MGTPTTQRGEWPWIDLVLVTDYPDPGNSAPRHFFRLHLDLEVEASDLPKLQQLLAGNKLGEVLKLLEEKIRKEDGPRAYAALKGALGLK